MTMSKTSQRRRLQRDRAKSAPHLMEISWAIWAAASPNPKKEAPLSRKVQKSLVWSETSSSLTLDQANQRKAFWAVICTTKSKAF